MANPSTNDDSKFEFHNKSYDVSVVDTTSEVGRARLYTLEMHGVMTMDVLNEALLEINADIEALEGDILPSIHFRAVEGASVSNAMANLQLTTAIASEKTPMGKFVRLLGEKRAPILNNANDSKINWLVWAVGTAASKFKIELNIKDVDYRDVPIEIVKGVMSERKAEKEKAVKLAAEKAATQEAKKKEM
jgi:hypothetical protein